MNLLWRRLLLEIDPESGNVDQQTDQCNGEELQLQLERQDLEQQFDFGLQCRAQNEQLHERLLLLALTLA